MDYPEDLPGWASEENRALGLDLDLSNNPNLEVISIMACDIRTINLSNCSNLKYLDVGANRLTELDLSDCINLEYLIFSKFAAGTDMAYTYWRLSELDVSN